MIKKTICTWSSSVYSVDSKVLQSNSSVNQK